MVPPGIWWLRVLSVVDHDIRDIRNVYIESFSDDQIACDIHDGAQNDDGDDGDDDDHDDDDISSKRWKFAYSGICDKGVSAKNLRLKMIQSMNDPGYHKAYVWAWLYPSQGHTEHWYEIMTGLPKTTE